jgi:hypothetical protein
MKYLILRVWQSEGYLSPGGPGTFKKVEAATLQEAVLKVLRLKPAKAKKYVEGFEDLIRPEGKVAYYDSMDDMGDRIYVGTKKNHIACAFLWVAQHVDQTGVVADAWPKWIIPICGGDPIGSEL